MPGREQHVKGLIENAKTYLGLPYDVRYEMDDQKIYCSELVYKAYRTASGESLGLLVKLGDLNWQPYQRTIEAIEKGPVPIDRIMITPRHLSEAKQLERIHAIGVD